MRQAPVQRGNQSRFELVRRLGAGGMGEVFEAVDHETGTRVALKRLLTMDPESLLRLKAEFRVLRDFGHRNLVSLGELVEDQGNWFFTMELLEGQDVVSFIRPNDDRTGQPPSETAPNRDSTTNEVAMPSAAATLAPVDHPKSAQRRSAGFDEQRLRTCLRQLCEGLAALHAAGKVHRDIKPPNILVTREERLVVLDFGLASSLHAAAGAEGKLMGTPTYMAPELTQEGSVVTPASDWYSVGVVLYEALVGAPPMRGSDAHVLLYKQRFEVPRPSELVEGIPPDLDALCTQLLRIDPGERPSGQAVLHLVGAAETPTSYAAHRSGAEAAVGLVGREAELAELSGALASSHAGGAVSVVVQGPSGVGKSSLAAEFVARARREHPSLLVLRARCHERESVPYKAFDGIADELSAFMADLTEAEQQALWPADFVLLARAFPVLLRFAPAPAAGASPAATPPVTRDDGPEQRMRLFSAFRELIENLARTRKLLLLVDDLQWADADSLALMQELFRPRAPSLLLVTTVRTDAQTAWNPSGRVLGVNVRHIRVAPLSRQHAGELAAVLLRHSGIDAAVAQEIARDADGHPLFIHELAQHARRGSGRHGAASHARGLDDVLWARVLQLPPDARHALSLVAAAGSPLSNELLGRAAEVPPEALNQALTTLRHQQFIRADGIRRSDRVESFHDRVRESVLGHLSDPERRGCHERLARAMEASHDADAEALVMHWEGAGRPERAVEYAIRAGDLAMHALGFEHATRLYRRCLQLPIPHAAPLLRKLHLKLAEALTQGGHLAEAGEAYLDAAKFAEHFEAVQARLKGVNSLLQAGQLARGRAIAEEVMGGLGLAIPASPQQAVLTVLKERLRLRLRGLGYQERPEHEIPPQTLLRVDALGALASFGMIDTLVGAALSATHTRLALDAGEIRRIGRALTDEYTIQRGFSERDTPATRALDAQLVSISERLQQPHLECYILLQKAAVHYMHGEFEGVIAKLRTFDEVRLVKRPPMVGELPVADYFHSSSLGYAGEWAGLPARLRTQLKVAKATGNLFSATFSTAGVPIGWLVTDDAEMLASEVDEAMARWPNERMYMVHCYEMLARSSIDLYRGDGAASLAQFESRMPALKRSLFLHMPILRVTVQERCARSALMIAQQSTGQTRRAALRRARTGAARLRRGAVSWCVPMAKAYAAMIAAMESRTEHAVTLLEQAEAGFATVPMKMMVHAARRRRGELQGGSEGRALVEAADQALRSNGVVRPDRMLTFLLPGPHG